jgi:hypothetical protein
MQPSNGQALESMIGNGGGASLPDLSGGDFCCEGNSRHNSNKNLTITMKIP